jgi:GH18 family chitinase
MFEDFKKLTGVKKIMSFGGWSFSTEADTFPIFRDGVSSAQRLAFANNVVQFAIDNNLDGLDFDWEYPGTLRYIEVMRDITTNPQQALLIFRVSHRVIPTTDQITSSFSRRFAEDFQQGRRLVSPPPHRSGT